MKLRIILLVLSLLAFLSASTGGYLYYSSLKESAFEEADRQTSLNGERIKNHISSFLSEYLKSVKTLAGLNELRQSLVSLDTDSIAKSNFILDHFRDTLKVDVCYLMGHTGRTIASSNRNNPDSFVGKNYSFRPYFQQALQGSPSIYMALGVTSKKRGVYYSHPVYGTEKDFPEGVVVIKASIDLLEKDIGQTYEGIVLLTDPNGIVFISNHKNWLYNSLWRLSHETKSRLARTQQFGNGPWNWTGMIRKDMTHAVDKSEKQYLIREIAIENYPGWNVVFLRTEKEITGKFLDPLMKTTGSIILIICILIGLSVFYLYRKASHDIIQRKAAEEALRVSEEKALALLNAPTDSALLIDTQGKILALNKPAADLFYKGIDSLVGMSFFDLFPKSMAKRIRAHHNEVIHSGNPVRYEDKRKGRYMDTNIYPVFDSMGNVVGVAIFSRDITEQKSAEEELKQAKEELSNYSKDLEKKLRKRTKEITNIIRNTPAVVYIKDQECKYIMVNPRYEELYGITNEHIQGKTDYEVFPKQTADRFRAVDSQVFNEGRFSQVEEHIAQEDTVHTYLSLKFPLYDEDGDVHSLCGISTDITELKKAQDQLRRLSAGIMNSQEKERAAIARELHDELGQVLTALRMDSVWLKDHVAKNNPEAGKRALSMCNLIDSTLDQVRNMAIRLRPGVLDDLGLIDALEWYAGDFEEHSGIACIFSHKNSPHINDMLATAAYRIAQEALTNVARHSSATQVDIMLESTNGMLTLSVTDNGNGFDIRKLAESGGLGIAGMRERAGLAGGTLEIKSKPNKGTRIFFRVPNQDKLQGKHSNDQSTVSR